MDREADHERGWSRLPRSTGSSASHCSSASTLVYAPGIRECHARLLPKRRTKGFKAVNLGENRAWATGVLAFARFGYEYDRHKPLTYEHEVFSSQLRAFGPLR